MIPQTQLSWNWSWNVSWSWNDLGLGVTVVTMFCLFTVIHPLSSWAPSFMLFLPSAVSAVSSLTSPMSTVSSFIPSPNTEQLRLTKSYEQKDATPNVLSTCPSTRVNLSQSGNVDLARQVVRHQGPTEPKHSQHSAFKSRAFSNRLKATI